MFYIPKNKQTNKQTDMNNWSKITGTVCAAAFLVGSVHGQEENAKEPIDNLAPFNVIGSKADIPSLQGSGTVLDTTDLKPFFHTDINEILRQVPGVYVRPEEGYGLFPNISLRGVDPGRSQKVTILEDGIPASPSPFSAPSAYYSPTAGRMAGFEILKGSSSLKYGPNNSGGVINYLSTPIPEDQASKIRGSYGAFNEKIAHAYSGGTVDFAGGKLGYLLEVFDHRTDGWKTVADDTTTSGGVIKGGEAPVYKNDILFKLGYEFGDGNYLEFKTGRTDLDGDVSYLGVTKNDFNTNPYQRYAGTIHDNMDSDQSRYYLRYLKEFSDTTKLSAAFFSNEFNRDWYKISKVNGNKVGEGIMGTNADVLTLKGEQNGTILYKHNDRTYETAGLQANLEFELANHSFDLGFRYTNDDYTYNPGYTEDTYDMTDEKGLSLSSSSGPKDTGDDTYMESDALELYLLDEFSIGSLTLAPGVRYTSVDYYTHGGNYGGVHTDQSISTTLFGIGSTYDFGSNILFAGVHQGQALPGPKTKGAYEEETSLGFEIGIRSSGDSAFAYEISYFNTSFDDMLIYPSIGAGAGTEQSQVGEVDTSGFEAVVATDLGNDSFGVPLQVAFTYTDATYGSSMETAKDKASNRYDNATNGNSIPFIPELQVNLRGGLVLEKFSTYLNYHWQDDVYVNGSNSVEITDFDATIPAYGILDWSGFFEIKEGVTAFAKVTNLADKEYRMSDLPDGYRPGAPRIWSVGMSYDF